MRVEYLLAAAVKIVCLPISLFAHTLPCTRPHGSFSSSLPIASSPHRPTPVAASHPSPVIASPQCPLVLATSPSPPVVQSSRRPAPSSPSSLVAQLPRRPSSLVVQSSRRPAPSSPSPPVALSSNLLAASPRPLPPLYPQPRRPSPLPRALVVRPWPPCDYLSGPNAPPPVSAPLIFFKIIFLNNILSLF